MPRNGSRVIKALGVLDFAKIAKAVEQAKMHQLESEAKATEQAKMQQLESELTHLISRSHVSITAGESAGGISGWYEKVKTLATGLVGYSLKDFATQHRPAPIHPLTAAIRASEVPDLIISLIKDGLVDTSETFGQNGAIFLAFGNADDTIGSLCAQRVGEYNEYGRNNTQKVINYLQSLVGEASSGGADSLDT